MRTRGWGVVVAAVGLIAAGCGGSSGGGSSNGGSTPTEAVSGAPQFGLTLQAGESELSIPRLGLDVLVVEGDDDTSLRAGVGHRTGTPAPCAAGNVVIRGERVDFGHPFRQLNTVGPGSLIGLRTPHGTCTYTVSPAVGRPTNPYEVAPEDPEALAQPTDASTHQLTLVTTDPPDSGQYWLILRAELTGASGT